MRKKIHFHLSSLVLLVILLGDAFNSSAQSGFANIWYFGSNAGMDFNSGVPVALTNSAMYTSEGCASIADANGNLLFYTNGIQVWDRTHTQMPNGFGLLGDLSSTQSGVIVPWPGNPDKYFIFTAAGFGGGPFCYSVVDMTLNGGNGDVTGVKNVVLIPFCNERVNAVLHQNGTDIWVLSQQYNTNNYFAFLVTAAGITGAPVISSGGPILGPANFSFLGTLKSNAQGTKVAVADANVNNLLMFDFNNSTGVLSNLIQFPSVYQYSYATEFSPDGTRLYATTMEPDSKIWQFDLTSGIPATIFASATIISTNAGLYHYGTLQTGPDGKIYVARNIYNYVGVINDPNQLGIACNYVDDGVFLGGMMCNWGLPDFIQSFFNPIDVTFINTCFGDSTFFFPTDTAGVTSYSWDFGDLGSGANNFSSAQSPFHIYSDTGSHDVQLIYVKNGTTDTIDVTVLITPLPFVDLGNDTTICNANSILLVAGDSSFTYLWQNGSTDTSFLVNTAGDYFVSATNMCGVAVDSVHIDFGVTPTVSFLDSTLCEGESYLLTATNAGDTYQWQNGSTDSTFSITQDGTYYVQVTSPSCGTASDTAHVDFLSLQKPDIGPDTTLCLGNMLILHSDIPDVEYYWSNGTNGISGSDFVISKTGTYTLTVSNKCGFLSDTLSTIYHDCNVCIYVPNAFTPNGDGINDVFLPISYCSINSFNMKVFTRWGQLVFETNDMNDGWNGINQGMPGEMGTYVYVLHYTNNGDLGPTEGSMKGNVTLIR